MNTYTLSTGEDIVLNKIESISSVDHKNGYKGALYEFVIYMDSGREISISHADNLPLIKERDLLLKNIQKSK